MRTKSAVFSFTELFAKHVTDMTLQGHGYFLLPLSPSLHLLLKVKDDYHKVFYPVMPERFLGKRCFSDDIESQQRRSVDISRYRVDTVASADKSFRETRRLNI